MSPPSGRSPTVLPPSLTKRLPLSSSVLPSVYERLTSSSSPGLPSSPQGWGLRRPVRVPPRHTRPPIPVTAPSETTSQTSTYSRHHPEWNDLPNEHYYKCYLSLGRKFTITVPFCPTTVTSLLSLSVPSPFWVRGGPLFSTPHVPRLSPCPPLQWPSFSPSPSCLFHTYPARGPSAPPPRSPGPLLSLPHKYPITRSSPLKKGCRESPSSPFPVISNSWTTDAPQDLSLDTEEPTNSGPQTHSKDPGGII